MENDQITQSIFIEVNVIDRENLSFYFNPADGSTIKVIKSDPACKIYLYEEAFERLLSGDSTFEDEVNAEKLTISGDSEILRNFGNSLRKI